MIYNLYAHHGIAMAHGNAVLVLLHGPIGKGIDRHIKARTAPT